MERITVSILNWEKYNPRKDIKHPTWFALSNRFLEDPDFFAFDPLELKALIYIFSQASQKNSATVPLVFLHAERVCGIPVEVLLSTIGKLQNLGCVQTEEGACTTPVRTRTDSVRDTTLQDTTRHNTTEQNKESSSAVVKLPTTVEVVKETKALKPIGQTEVVDFENDFDVLSAIAGKTKARWAQLYPDPDFLRREALKAFNWYSNNPIKRPRSIRGWVRALSSWFEKSWRHHVKTIPSEAGGSIDWNQVFSEREGA